MNHIHQICPLDGESEYFDKSEVYGRPLPHSRLLICFIEYSRCQEETSIGWLGGFLLFPLVMANALISQSLGQQGGLHSREKFHLQRGALCQDAFCGKVPCFLLDHSKKPLHYFPLLITLPTSL